VQRGNSTPRHWAQTIGMLSFVDMQAGLEGIVGPRYRVVVVTVKP